jgi:hypothetical protein
MRIAVVGLAALVVTAAGEGSEANGFWASAIWDTAPEAVLVDADWKLTEAGAAYERLMAAWSTDVTAPVAADGTIDFTGFYGDYTVEVAGKTFPFELVRGKTAYNLGAP